jgi:hypothetical protein
MQRRAEAGSDWITGPQERPGRAAAFDEAPRAAREPDDPAAPIGPRVWPPHRDLPVHRARWAQTGKGEL